MLVVSAPRHESIYRAKSYNLCDVVLRLQILGLIYNNIIRSWGEFYRSNCCPLWLAAPLLVSIILRSRRTWLHHSSNDWQSMDLMVRRPVDIVGLERTDLFIFSCVGWLEHLWTAESKLCELWLVRNQPEYQSLLILVDYLRSFPDVVKCCSPNRPDPRDNLLLQDWLHQLDHRPFSQPSHARR